MKSKLFQGQVVVVTGASAGVGRAVVRAFARDGADVALIARGVDGLEAAAKEVRAYGGRALVLPLDIADAAAVKQRRTEPKRNWGQSRSGSTMPWFLSFRR